MKYSSYEEIINMALRLSVQAKGALARGDLRALGEMPFGDLIDATTAPARCYGAAARPGDNWEAVLKIINPVVTARGDVISAAEAQSLVAVSPATLANPSAGPQPQPPLRMFILRAVADEYLLQKVREMLREGLAEDTHTVPSSAVESLEPHTVPSSAMERMAIASSHAAPLTLEVKVSGNKIRFLLRGAPVEQLESFFSELFPNPRSRILSSHGTQSYFVPFYGHAWSLPAMAEQPFAQLEFWYPLNKLNNILLSEVINLVLSPLQLAPPTSTPELPSFDVSKLAARSYMTPVPPTPLSLPQAQACCRNFLRFTRAYQEIYGVNPAEVDVACAGSGREIPEPKKELGVAAFTTAHPFHSAGLSSHSGTDSSSGFQWVSSNSSGMSHGRS
jgi:hypothetical protein